MIVAIDQGTTSTRALRLDSEGAVAVTASRAHRQHYPSAGCVEHDPNELLAHVRSCIDSVPDATAVGIANQGESCLAWHAETGEALSPVIVWQDQRTLPAVEALKAGGAEALVLSLAGLPLDAYFSASKLAWLVHNVDGAQALLAAGKLRLGTTDAWFLQRLTGRCVTDVTTASRTSLMNLETGEWDARLCELFGVPMQALPTVGPTTGDFGTCDLAGRAVPVTASVVDQQAALYGHGCASPGDAKVTFGTGAFALAITGADIVRAPERGLLPTVAWQRAGQPPVFALDGGVTCASAAVNWARSLGLFDTFDQINAFAGPPAIARGLVFVPALAGLACPHWDRSAAGLWLGMSLDTTPHDLVQAVLEGVALRGAEVIAAMHEHVTLSGAISIDGGMAANPYFCQFLADASGKDIVVPGYGELTALGTALLAGPAHAPQRAGDAVRYTARGDGAGLRERFAGAVDRAKGWR